MQAQGWTPPCPREEPLHALSSQKGILLPASSQAAPQQDLLSSALGGYPFTRLCHCGARCAPMEEPMCVFCRLWAPQPTLSELTWAPGRLFACFPNCSPWSCCVPSLAEPKKVVNFGMGSVSRLWTQCVRGTVAE